MGVLPKLITFCFSSHFSIISSFSIFSFQIFFFIRGIWIYQFIQLNFLLFFLFKHIVFTPVEPVLYSTPDSVLPSLSTVHYVSISSPSLQVIVSERFSFIHSLSSSILSSNTSTLIFLNLLHSFSTNVPEHLEIKRYLQNLSISFAKWTFWPPSPPSPRRKPKGFLHIKVEFFYWVKYNFFLKNFS